MINALRLLLQSALTKPHPTKSDDQLQKRLSSNSVLQPVFMDMSPMYPYATWGPMPKDVWMVIFAFLEVKHLRRLLFVNKSFSRLAAAAFAKVSETSFYFL